jgi:hypothetical protein
MIPILDSDFLILAQKGLRWVNPEASITLVLKRLKKTNVVGNI